MPLCGFFGMPGSAFWWVAPLIGLVLMALMFLVCFRGFGCMGGCRRRPGEFPDVHRDIEALKEDVRKLQREPS